MTPWDDLGRRTPWDAAWPRPRTARTHRERAQMCSELPLGLSTDFPLQRWLRDAEARVSGYVLLAGNASAHERALECQLRETARDRPELLQIASRSAWHDLSCADGCPSLADDVARLMRERSGRWSVVLVQAAVGLGLGLGLGLVGLG